MTRSLNGGVDELPLPEIPGRLFLCGKHFIGPDPVSATARVGATTVVCLNQRYELDDRYPHYVAWLEARSDHAAIWHPIPDLHAPEFDAAVELVALLQTRLSAGEVLLMHCAAGIGRTGTMAAALLIAMGTTYDDALAMVAASRPMAGPEVGSQQQLLRRLGERYGPRLGDH